MKKILLIAVASVSLFAWNTETKADAYKSEQAVFDELRDIMVEMGSLVPESELLETIAKDKKIQNHIHLYLVLGDYFKKEKEDDHFQARWHVDHEVSDEVHESLKKLYGTLSDEELLVESEIIGRFLNSLKTYWMNFGYFRGFPKRKDIIF